MKKNIYCKSLYVAENGSLSFVIDFSTGEWIVSAFIEKENRKVEKRFMLYKEAEKFFLQLRKAYHFYFDWEEEV